MKKTPRGENARLISNVHLEHETQKITENYEFMKMEVLPNEA